MTYAEKRKQQDDIVIKWWEETLKRAYEAVGYRLSVGDKALDREKIRAYIESVSK